MLWRSAHLPLWAMYVQAIGPVVVAFIAFTIAGFIQHRQYKVANDKLRLDLFEKRFKIASALEWSVGTVMPTHPETSRTIMERMEDLAGYGYLFDAATVAKIETAHFLMGKMWTEIIAWDDKSSFEQWTELVQAYREAATTAIKACGKKMVFLN